VIGEVQLRLAQGGYYHGAIDGVSGSETRRAIRAYEHAHALPQDGRIGQRLLTTIGDGAAPRPGLRAKRMMLPLTLA